MMLLSRPPLKITVMVPLTAILMTTMQCSACGRSRRLKCTLEQRVEQEVRRMLLILSATSPSIAVFNWKQLAVKCHRIS